MTKLSDWPCLTPEEQEANDTQYRDTIAKMLEDLAERIRNRSVAIDDLVLNNGFARWATSPDHANPEWVHVRDGKHELHLKWTDMLERHIMHDLHEKLFSVNQAAVDAYVADLDLSTKNKGPKDPD